MVWWFLVPYLRLQVVVKPYQELLTVYASQQSLAQTHLTLARLTFCMSDTTETQLAVHVAICEERYNHIERALRDGEKRMTKIEYLLYVVMACVLLGPGVAATLIHKLFGI